MRSQSQHYFFCFSFSNISHFSSFLSTLPTNPVESNDPNFSDFLVSHFDCSKQHNLRRFSFGAIAKVFLCAGPATLMLNVKNICVRNSILKIAVKIVLIINRTPWNVLVLQTPRNANMPFVTSRELIIFNLNLFKIVTLSPFLMLFKKSLLETKQLSIMVLLLRLQTLNLF